MRKWIALIGFALLLGVITVPAVAAPTVHQLEARLVDTHVFGVPADQVALAPGDDPGSNWSSDQIWHVRRLPVTETLESLDGTVHIGSLERSVNFNLNLATDASQAWCSFTMTLTDPALGAFDGHCSGSLLDGNFVANGETGHMQGVYRLESGGIPGVGPYVIELEVREH